MQVVLIHKMKLFTKNHKMKNIGPYIHLVLRISLFCVLYEIKHNLQSSVKVLVAQVSKQALGTHEHSRKFVYLFASSSFAPIPSSFSRGVDPGDQQQRRFWLVLRCVQGICVRRYWQIVFLSDITIVRVHILCFTQTSLYCSLRLIPHE